MENTADKTNAIFGLEILPHNTGTKRADVSLEQAKEEPKDVKTRPMAVDFASICSIPRAVMPERGHMLGVRLLLRKDNTSCSRSSLHVQRHAGLMASAFPHSGDNPCLYHRICLMYRVLYAVYLFREPRRVVIEKVRAESKDAGGIRRPHLQVRDSN